MITTLRRMLVWFVVVSIAVLGGIPASAADRAAVKKSIASGAAYVRGVQGELQEGRASLATYALLKADGKPTDPGNAKVISDILSRCQGSKYKPAPGNDGVYAAGIEAMILSDIDPEKYTPQLKKIAAYLLSEQLENGSFDYRGEGSPGDTSVTQYGTLGLWAIGRVGIDIPGEVWDKLAGWHFKAQEKDGGFAYNPGIVRGKTGASTNGTMTAAAAANMAICAMFLHPRRMQQATGITDGLAQRRAAPQADPNNPLGVLTIRTPDPQAKPGGPTGPYQPRASFDQLQTNTRRTVGFVSGHFTTQYLTGGWRMYHYYTLERMGSLLDLETFGEHDWFNECADELIKTQLADGSWDMPGLESGRNHAVATSFGLLFLTRSTAKLLNRLPPEDPIGGGIQAGGRGLPDDLSSVKLQNGRVEEVKSTGPLDDLLQSLESANVDDLFNVQTQIVKKIQLGDRSELIGQTERLIKLVEHPNPEIRRIALWALARSNDLTVARLLVAALEDPDADVLTEAHNALCWMSRRPNAFDIPASPIGHLPPSATEQQQEAAVRQWRMNTLSKWGNWYLRNCPYEEKSTPFALDLARKIGAK